MVSMVEDMVLGMVSHNMALEDMGLDMDHSKDCCRSSSLSM